MKRISGGRTRGMHDGGVKLKYPEQCPHGGKCSWKKYQDCEHDQSNCFPNHLLFRERFKARFIEGETLTLILNTYMVNGVPELERNRAHAIKDEAMARTNRSKKATKAIKARKEESDIEKIRQQYCNYTKGD